MPNRNHDFRIPVGVKPSDVLVEQSLKSRRLAAAILLLVLVLGGPSFYFHQQGLQHQWSLTATAISLQSTSSVLTQAAMPSPSSIPPTLPPPTPAATATAIPPTTRTSIPTICTSIIKVTSRKESSGNFLSVDCNNGYLFDVGPLADGAYSIGPNKKFLLYCTNDGYLYALTAKEKSLRYLNNLRKELPVLRKERDINLVISYITGENQYWARIRETYSGQSTDIPISKTISN